MADLIDRQALLKELHKWDMQDLYLPAHFQELVMSMPADGRLAEVCEYNDDLFNKLVEMKAERDAAVADLEEISFCCNCKQALHRDGLSVWCGGYSDWFEWNDTCTEWEWRGVQHERN